MKVGQTSVVTSLDPEWNAEFTHGITTKRGELPKLRCEVFDKDTLSSDDPLGYVELDITACVDAPSTWAIDGAHILQSKSPSE